MFAILVQQLPQHRHQRRLGGRVIKQLRQHRITGALVIRPIQRHLDDVIHLRAQTTQHRVATLQLGGEGISHLVKILVGDGLAQRMHRTVHQRRNRDGSGQRFRTGTRSLAFRIGRRQMLDGRVQTALVGELQLRQ